MLIARLVLRTSFELSTILGAYQRCVRNNILIAHYKQSFPETTGLQNAQYSPTGSLNFQKHPCIFSI